MKFILSLFLSAFIGCVSSQDALKLALVKYHGGGDWYANLETSLPNLARFCNDELGTNLSNEQAIVDLNDRALYQYPFLHLTGHGNIIFNDAEIQNLRNYLVAGGFLHIDDNYGMDQFIRPQMKKVFPELDFVELPSTHPIFHQKFAFDKGLPKIHEHDNNRPQALGLYHDGRLVCLYTFESDLGDGWEDPRIHNDTEENHLKALRMGANLIQFVFMSNEPNEG
ncbi:MAG: DUF4159 domain-containing protein [Flavobacteriales bacterium]